MKKFKALQSPNQFFSFKGEMYEFIDGYFETEDAELIEFLAINPNCELISEPTKKK